MIKPLIYATCDQKYYDAHAEAFTRSAEKFGNKVKIDIVKVGFDPKIRNTEARIHYCAARFTRLPELLDEHPHIMISDIDAVFNSTIEFDEKYDLGIFLRPWLPKELRSLQVLCAAFYATRKAKAFTEFVRENIYKYHAKWLFDQRAVWFAYQQMSHQFNIMNLGTDFLNYDFKTEAPIWTGKGNRKDNPVYLARKNQYENAHA